MEPIQIRPVAAGDISALHAMNEAAVPEVGSVTRQEFTRLVFDQADKVLVALRGNEPVGFVLCLLEGIDYGSLNYKWISERCATFAYVDRIAVSQSARGQGIGGQLYEKIFREYGGRRPVLMAEVNLEPPNPGSLRFHKRMGFREIGERWEEGRAKGVVYLERSLLEFMD